VCLVVGDILLSGDHVLSHKIPQQWPESIHPYTGLGHYLDSLEKVERLLGISLVLGGHEAPFDDLAGRVDEIRRMQFRRLDRVLKILRENGPLTIHELAGKMYPVTAGFHVMLGLQDTASRVEYLHQRGRLVVANLEQVENDEKAVCRFAPA
jgi:hypothetical protein